MPSADLKGSGSSVPKLKEAEFKFTAPLLYDDENIADYLNCLVRLLYPHVYNELELAADRCTQWLKGSLPPGTRIANGVLMGRVTIYKLQTAMHRDIRDCICAIICTGRFEGGEGIFPDLNLKLR